MANEEKPYYPCRYFIRDGHLFGEDINIGFDKIWFDLLVESESDRMKLLDQFMKLKSYDEELMRNRFHNGYFRTRDFHVDFKETLMLFYQNQENTEEYDFWKKQEIIDFDKFLSELEKTKM